MEGIQILLTGVKMQHLFGERTEHYENRSYVLRVNIWQEKKGCRTWGPSCWMIFILAEDADKDAIVHGYHSTSVGFENPLVGVWWKVLCLSSFVCQINISHKQLGQRWDTRGFCWKGLRLRACCEVRGLEKSEGVFGFLEVTFDILATQLADQDGRLQQIWDPIGCEMRPRMSKRGGALGRMKSSFIDKKKPREGEQKTEQHTAS